MSDPSTPFYAGRSVTPGRPARKGGGTNSKVEDVYEVDFEPEPATIAALSFGYGVVGVTCLGRIDMLLAEAIAEYIDARAGEVSATTLANYARSLEKLAPLHHLPVREISTTHLRRLRASLAESHKPGAINTYQTAWKVFFNWAVVEGVIDQSPAARMRKLRVKPALRAVALPDAQAMIKAAVAADNWRDVSIMVLLLSTGVRINALRHIRLADIDWENAAIRVIEKGDQPRTLHLVPQCYEAVALYAHSFLPAGAIWLFPSPTTAAPLTRATLWQMLQRYARQLNIRSPVHPHAWRHAFTVEMLRNGASLDAVSKLLGHASVSITEQYYARWHPDKLRDDLAKYNPLS